MIPIAMLLFCPYCHFEHIDRDEWAMKPHRTHLCEHCGERWRPSNRPTVGVKELPDDEALLGVPYYIVEDRFYLVSFDPYGMYEILHKPKGCLWLNPAVVPEARGWVRDGVEKFLKTFKHDPTDDISLAHRIDWIMKPLMIDAVKKSVK